MSENLDLEDRIRAAFEGLSPGHRRIVDYLLSSESAAALSTAREIGEALGISESTVVRLAPELGFEGFPSLQAAFRRRLLSKIKWRPSLQEAIDTLPDSPVAVMRQVLENDIQAIQTTLSTVNPESFERAVSAIVGADTVYVLGLRSSAGHAMYAAHRLRLIHPKTRLLSPHFGDLPDQMLGLERGDLLLAISYPRYTTDTLRALRLARKRSATTLVVTDKPISPAAAAADILLVCPGPSTPLVDSIVAPMSLLNALISAVGVLGRDDARARIATAYTVIDDFEVVRAPSTS